MALINIMNIVEVVSKVFTLMCTQVTTGGGVEGVELVRVVRHVMRTTLLEVTKKEQVMTGSRERKRRTPSPVQVSLAHELFMSMHNSIAHTHNAV